MTRPIYEPNLTRADAYLDFQQQQLFRRPAPSPLPVIKYMVGKSINTAQTLTHNAAGNIVWQCNVNNYTECFEPIVFAGLDYYQIRIKEDGLFTVSLHLAIDDTSAGTANYQLALWTPEHGTAGTLYHRAWPGFTSAGLLGADAYGQTQFDWTFRMDGTGGSNRTIEFQYVNFDLAADVTTEVDGTYIEIYKWPGIITMDGRDRTTCP